MNDIDPTLAEQLCAYLDGELPPDQARFLERRLARDPALRAQWERWQLASACLRGQPLQPMPAGFAPAVAAAIAREPRRHGPWPWLATAAAAVLIAVLLPGRPVTEPGPARLALPTAPAAGPGAAPAAPTPMPPALADAGDPLAPVSSFPLAEDAPRPWPRSPLATDDRQLEAYLVGHNTLMAQDGLGGGFIPYVDVVAHDDGAPAPTGDDR
jgi:hypothetical protein